MHKRIVKGFMNVGGQIVEATSLPCGKAAAKTRETQRVIADGADPVFRLPVAARSTQNRARSAWWTA
jgi:hypothetical protein